MDLDKKKDKVQQEALKTWIKFGKNGTAAMGTSMGKTFLALHALYTMPKFDDKIHLFLAEQTDREKDLLEQIEFYNKLFDKDVLKDYNLRFYCYQTVYKWKNHRFGLVIADEVHDSLTPSYHEFYLNNDYDALLGLSATIERKTSYIINGLAVTKGQLLDNIAPVFFTYSLNQGLSEDTVRKLKIHIIYHELDSENKNILAGSVKKRFYQTEKSAYDYWNKMHDSAWFLLNDDKREFQIKTSSYKRSRILFELPSKEEAVKKLIKNIEGKTILFGNSIASLKKVTPHVITSKNKEDDNVKIRENFDKGIINIIGSFKKLKQGANLKEVDNAILMSYYSIEKDIIQRIGRLRKNQEKEGNVYIFVTKATQEEKWFKLMMGGVSSYPTAYYDNIDNFILKQKNK